MDNDKYLIKQKEQAEKYEALCMRCGACCGIYDNDPCRNLTKDKQGKFFCLDYNNRLGEQSTVSGKPFRCVPVRVLLRQGLPNSRCPYAKGHQ